ncbi:MAG: hypothetical protein HYW48_02490 [Deltaproteobacteria bacterium]|nr:hypothetical protein [Deltaproteobacteria bacterium]
MFAVDSTEAIYRFIGIKTQEGVIVLLTHHWVFAAVVLFVIAWRLLRTGYFLPFRDGSFSLFVSPNRTLSVSQLIISLCVSLLLLSALKPLRILTIENFAGQNWSQHPLAGKRLTEATPKANTLFSYLAGGAEELAHLSHRLFNSMFAGGQANMESPRWLFKAMIQASAVHIDQPELLDEVEAYGEACLEPVIESLGTSDFWLKEEEHRSSEVWNKFATIHPFGGSRTCVDLREELAHHLLRWAATHPGTAHVFHWQPSGITELMPEFKSYDWMVNTFAANALRNHIAAMEGHALSPFHNPEGANFDNGSGVWRVIRKIFSVETWERFFFGNASGGSLSAANAAEELSRVLKVAPEVKGRILFFLIAAFPFFLFWAALRGVFGPLFFWTLMYFSIAMWEPLWSLSYNVLLAQMNAHKYLSALAELNDAISITAAETLRLRFNRAIEAYVFTQFGIATLVTSFAFWMGKGWLQQGANEGLPGGWLLRKLL